MVHSDNMTMELQAVGQDVEGSAIGLPAGYQDILTRWHQDEWAFRK